MYNHPSQIKQPLYENVARFIRKEILLGHWEHGIHINESKIAKELNMSRGPIRDALKLLENEGIIETPSNGRTIVIGFTKRDFIDWSNVRLYLETLAIEEAISHQLEHEMIDHLESVLIEMEKADHLEHHIFLDLQFHKGLVDLSGNRTLSKLWDTLSGTLSTMLELIATHYDNTAQITMHRSIIRAVKKGDKRAASKELERHIREGEKTIQSVITFVKRN